jgi:NAD+ synthase (glutamine-hydrolysing)
MRTALAQINTHVGAIEANADRVFEYADRARDQDADLVVFPELTLCGYPPEDLLFHRGMRDRVNDALERIRSDLKGIAAVVGYPEYVGDTIYNSAAVVKDGAIIANSRKIVLPNYSVFDEKRYFEPGAEACVIELAGVRIGITVCEDAWETQPPMLAAEAGAQVLLVINGSPYRIDKQQIRESVLQERVRETGLPLLYVNMVGGQDELVFDGGSVVLDHQAQVVQRAPGFKETLMCVDLMPSNEGAQVVPGAVAELESVEPCVYEALVTGTRDYINKNNFPGVVLGLSGGVDSGLTLAIAVDAVGADRVHTVMMPSRYTSDMSLHDAERQAADLGVDYTVLSIESMFEATLTTLADLFAVLPADATEENIQARCRGVLLMAVSNKLGKMLLTTGNKSEMAVGYATLYGDMAGGFAPIKDCTKTLVYRLARYRNTLGAAIPERVIQRPPSAELAPDQKDTDSLPPYDVLDPILEAFIEHDYSVDQIAALGFDRKIVGRVLGLVRRNEYKRRQAPPGVRVSGRAFGRDWRYPITSGYR